MIRAAGKRARMQPFMTPTKGPWCPKSVVTVMTPEADKLSPRCSRRSTARTTAAGQRARSLRACAATVGVGNGRQALRFDVACAHRAGRVAALREAAQRRLDLLQLRARGM